MSQLIRYPRVSALTLAALLAAGCADQRKPTPSVQQPPHSPVAPSSTKVGNGADWFVDGAADAGVDFRLGHKTKGPFVVLKLMGSGAAIADFDNDGNADIFLVAPEDIAPDRCVRLYRNLGKGKFQDVTALSGIDPRGMLMGCAAGDVDGDGMTDLLITGYGLNKLYRNQGGFKFTDITYGSGVEAASSTAWASSAAFADYDLDGKLDVFVGRYVIFNDKSIQFCDYGNGRKAACGPIFYDPQRGSLYRNLGGGKFKDVTDASGFNDVHGKVLGVAWADVNGDRYPDCYLANDEVNANLLMSGKGRKYRDDGLITGVALAATGQPHGGMGVDWGDYNRDGKLDLWVTTYQFETDALYAAGEGGLFREMSNTLGLDQPTRQPVGFGTKFLDVDNDGWLDIASTNGHIHDNQEEIDKLSTYRQPMQLFVNQRGETFEDRTKEAGAGFTLPAVGRGLAIGDLDNDGREDIVVTDMEGPVRVLFNRRTDTGSWIRISLKGKTSNRFGIGSLVTVTAGKERWVGNCTAGGSYLSSSDPRLHFGLGKVKKIDRVEVLWPSGKKSVVTSPSVNRDLMIVEAR